MSKGAIYTHDEKFEPVVCADPIAWGLFVRDHRVVRRTRIHTEHGEVQISTVFTGIDMNEPPQLWETMLFLDGAPKQQIRNVTRDESIKTHARLVAQLECNSN